MRNFIVIVSISLILALLSISEHITVKKFCGEMENSVSVIMEKISLDIADKKDIEKIENIWKKYKTAVFIFANHNIFKDYEDCIADMRYYYEFDKKEKLYFKTYSLYETNKRMMGSVRFDIGNIF